MKEKLLQTLNFNKECIALYKRTQGKNLLQDNTQKIRDLISENIQAYSELARIVKSSCKVQKKHTYEEVIYFNHLPFWKNWVNMKNITPELIEKEEDYINWFKWDYFNN